MTSIGGNWKELVGAATEGNLAIVRYHLDQGVDPNFQHPEFMTTPLLEAVKARQYDSVRLLLEHPNNRANPTIEGDWEGTTPLEEAMALKDHTMAQMILRKLPQTYESESMVVWIPNGVRTTCQRDLVTRLLDGGHCVLLTSKDRKQCQKWEESLVQPLRESTENPKIWAWPEPDLPDFFRGGPKNSSGSCCDNDGDDGDDEWRPWGIDVWLHTGTTDADSPIDTIASVLGPKSDVCLPFRGHGGVPRVLSLMDSHAFSGREELAYLLRETNNDRLVSAALAEPSTFRNRLAYAVWYRHAWLETAVGLLVRMATERDGNYQKALDVTGKPLTVPATFARVEAWDERLAGCLPKKASSKL